MLNITKGEFREGFTLKLHYELEPNNGYDGFGEPLRDDLEDWSISAQNKGYSIRFTVTAELYKGDYVNVEDRVDPEDGLTLKEFMTEFNDNSDIDCLL